MSSNVTRALVGAMVVVIAGILLIVLKKNGNSGKTEGGKLETIVLKDGKPVGGIAQLTYNKGEKVLFRVDSDVTDEVHVHGYEIMKDVRAGGSVTFAFPATIEGVFEAELEGRKEQILEMTVNP